MCLKSSFRATLITFAILDNVSAASTLPLSYKSGTGEFTINRRGIYSIAYALNLKVDSAAGNAFFGFQFFIYKNGVAQETVQIGSGPYNGPAAPTCQYTLLLTATDLTARTLKVIFYSKTT